MMRRHYAKGFWPNSISPGKIKGGHLTVDCDEEFPLAPIDNEMVGADHIEIMCALPVTPHHFEDRPS